MELTIDIGMKLTMDITQYTTVYHIVSHGILRYTSMSAQLPQGSSDYHTIPLPVNPIYIYSLSVRLQHLTPHKVSVSSKMAMAESYIDQCDIIINGLINSDVNFVCLDFDLTFVNLHSCTDGGWQGSSEELRTHIRPIFEAFVPLAIEKCNAFVVLLFKIVIVLCCQAIHVAVVTFSPQTILIRNVLMNAFGDSIAAKVCVYNMTLMLENIFRNSI